MISAISVKDRLKNQAKEDGRTMQDELVTYGLERAIYRLSISEYAERFTLKGGIFLYALFDGNFARATMDIDLLAQYISNDAAEMKKVFYDIKQRSEEKGKPDLNILFIYNMPFRALAKMTAGMVSMDMAEGIAMAVTEDF